jgi:hypothetical protein
MATSTRSERKTDIEKMEYEALKTEIILKPKNSKEAALFDPPRSMMNGLIRAIWAKSRNDEIRENASNNESLTF